MCRSTPNRNLLVQQPIQNNSFIVPKLKFKTVRGLLDTGSVATIVSEHSVKRYGLTIVTPTANFANYHAKRAQASYAAHYNLRARDKRFHMGDQVIVLAPEGGNQLRIRWQGPATVVKVKPPHNYLVDMEDGSVRKVHANKIRQFVARV